MIPTVGRATLRNTISSIPEADDIEVIVVADGEDAHRAALNTLAGLQRPIVVACTDRTEKVGHPQRDRGMRLAHGTWLSFMDDDDAYTRDAFEHLRDATWHDGPHLFRMRYPHGEVLWAHESLCRGNVGTPMFFCRNDRLGHWKPERTGDFDFIESTCMKQGRPVWHPEVICHVRPSEES